MYAPLRSVNTCNENSLNKIPIHCSDIHLFLKYNKICIVLYLYLQYNHFICVLL